MTSKFKVPAQFTVPDTIEGVVGLLTARGWEKAAIVYAYTRPDSKADAGRKGGGSTRENPPASEITVPCSFTEFASLGIWGLSDRDAVAHYRKQWVKGIEEGWADMVGPGDTFDVPDRGFPVTHSRYNPEDWPEYATEAEAAGVSFATAKRAGANKAAIGAAIKADPEVEKAARRALVDKEIERDRQRAVDKARNRKIVDDFVPEKESAGLTAREIDETEDQFDGLVIKLRAMKRQGQDVLNGTLNLGGFRQKAKRSLIVEMVDEVRNILDAIAEAAEGRSMDDELASLLEGGK